MKVGIFYTGLLPAFVVSGQHVAAWIVVLAAVHLVLSAAWLGFYSWLVARVRQALTAPPLRRLVDCVTGVALVALGLAVARDAARTR